MFRFAKQLVSKNRDVVSTSCVKDDGKIVVEEDKDFSIGSGCGNWKDEARQICGS